MPLRLQKRERRKGGEIKRERIMCASTAELHPDAGVFALVCEGLAWSPMLVSFLNHLQVVARDQPALAAAPVHLGLPPPVVLVAEDREDVALVEPELLGDGCLVHVHRTCCRKSG